MTHQRIHIAYTAPRKSRWYVAAEAVVFLGTLATILAVGFLCSWVPR